MTTPVTVPLNLVTQLRSGYQNCLIDFYVDQHDAMCPLCHPQDSGVYVDRMVPAESVPWSAFAQECLMNVVRPVVYALVGENDPLLEERSGSVVLSKKSDIKKELKVTRSAVRLLSRTMLYPDEVELMAITKAKEKIRARTSTEHSSESLQWLTGDGDAVLTKDEAFDDLLFRLEDDVRSIRDRIGETGGDIILDASTLKMHSLSETTRSLQLSGFSIYANSLPSNAPPPTHD